MMGAVGFIGLGAMGSAIAHSLLREGHELVVWNRSAAKIDELVASGAVAARSPQEALSTAVSFSMLANDVATESVLTRENLRTASGGIHCCMASLSPTATDRLQAVFGEASVRYISTPVLGRPDVASRGALNILVAGDPEAIGVAQPLLDSVSTRTWFLGEEPRIANVVKVAVNYNIIHALQALAESISLVERHGTPGQEFVELLTSTLFDGVVYRGYGNLIADHSYFPAGFSLELGRKDLGLAIQTAAEAGLELPTAPVLVDLFERALSEEALRGADWAAVAEITRRQAR